MAIKIDDLYWNLQVKLADERISQKVQEVERELSKLEKTTSKLDSSRGARGLNDLGQAAEKAAPGLRKAQTAVTNLALGMVGLKGTSGELVEGLLLLGAGSAVVAGVAAGIALIGFAYDQLTAKARAAEAAAKSSLTTLKDVLRASELSRDAVGTLTAEVADLAKEEADLRNARSGVQARVGSGSEREGDTEKVRELTARIVDLENRRLALGIQLGDAHRQARDDAEREAKAAEAAAKSAAQQAESLQDRTRQANAAGLLGLAELSGDPLQQKLAQLDAQIAAVRDTQQDLGTKAPAALQAWLDKLVETRTATEDLRQTLERTLITAESLPDTLPDLTPSILRGARERDGPNQAGASQLSTDKTRLQVLEAQAQALEAQAGQVQRAVTGALQLGEAFGAVGENVARILTDVSQVATSIPVLINGIKILNAGGGAAGAISGALGVLGALASLGGALFGGDSPEEKAARQTLQDNTAALDRVRAGLEDFGGNLTGTQLASARSITQKSLNLIDNNPAGSFIPSVSLAQAQNAFGLTAKDLLQLQDVAKEFGLTLDGSRDSWEKLNAAIDSADQRSFLDTFTGQLSSMRAEFELLDLTEPIQQIEALRKVISGDHGSPALKQALAGLDLTTPEGRDAADKIVKEFFSRLKGEGTPLTAGELGDLSRSQFLAFLEDFERTLDALDAATAPELNQSFAVTRSITEVTGERIASILTSATEYQRQTADNTFSTVVMLQRHEVLLAALVAGTSAPGAGPLDPAAVDRALGVRANSAALRAGNTVVQ